MTWVTIICLLIMCLFLAGPVSLAVGIIASIVGWILLSVLYMYFIQWQREDKVRRINEEANELKSELSKHIPFDEYWKISEHVSWVVVNQFRLDEDVSKAKFRRRYYREKLDEVLAREKEEAAKKEAEQKEAEQATDQTTTKKGGEHHDAQ